MVNFRPLPLAFLLLCGALSVSKLALAHGGKNEEVIWELSDQQLAELNKKIDQQVQLFSSLLERAMVAEAMLTPEQRDFGYDEKAGEVSIPRSLATRALMAAVNLEVLETEKSIFCGRRCSHGNPVKGMLTQHLGWWQRNWPKAKQIIMDNVNSMIHAVESRATHRQSYGRYLRAKAAFRSQSVGSASMIVGGAAATATWVTTETIESFVLSFATFGVGTLLHIACKANYFLSIAVGNAVASLSRDVKASYSFSSENARLLQGFRNLRDVIKARRTLNAIKSNIFVVEFEKARPKVRRYNQVDTVSDTAESILQSSAFRKLALADDLLWAEIVGVGKGNSEMAARESLETEFKEMLSSPKALLQWQDAHSALNLLVNGIRVSREALHIREKAQLDSLRSLGRLDLALRKLDFFMTLWLQRPVPRHQLQHSVWWLNGVYSEMLALLITINREGVTAENRENIDVRISSVMQNIEQSNREGSPTFYRLLGKERLFAAFPKPNVQACFALF